jgi:hypothetical protein
MTKQPPLKAKKPHPENFVWPENCKTRVAQVVEVVAFRKMKQSGLLVKVRYDDGHLSTWLHTKDLPVHTLYFGGTSALYTIYG